MYKKKTKKKNWKKKSNIFMYIETGLILTVELEARP